MTIETCLRIAKERFEKGEITRLRISFVTLRTNELVGEKICESKREAMAQANKDADSLNL